MDAIAGYTYAAEIYCPSCTETFFQQYAPNTPTLTEDVLNAAASVLGIDRMDERSFDSGDFPKVVLSGAVHDGCTEENGYAPGQCGNRCGSCGEVIDGSECPNVAE